MLRDVEAVETPIVKTGSSSDLTSFEDLENIDAPTPQPAKSAKESLGSGSKGGKKGKDNVSKKESQEEEESEDTDSVETKSKEKKGEKRDGDDKEKDQEKDSEEKIDDKVKQEQDKDKSAPKVDKSIKPIKFKAGDQEVDVRPDSTVEVTIDGKKESVTVKDLLSNYSGKINHHRKYQELDNERKAFHAEKQELQSGIDNILNLAKTDKLAATEFIFNALGENGREVLKELEATIVAHYEELAQLTPEERAQRKIQEEADFQKKRADRYEHENTKARQRQELDKRVKAQQEKYNLSNEQFVKRYDELIQLQKLGKLDQEITPEFVGLYHQAVERNDQITGILDEVNPGLEDKEAAFNQLRETWANNPDLTAAQMKSIALEVYGSQAAVKLAKKIQRSSGGDKKFTPQPKKPEKEPFNFDDLED